MNQDLIERLEAYEPAVFASPNSGGQISYNLLHRVLEVLRTHEVVGPEARPKYAREGVEIGYCFGRADFVYRLLRKVGLQSQVVKKLWLVGPQKNAELEIDWAYHVADIVFVDGYGWMAVDTNTFKIQPIELWYNSFFSKSVDGKARLYATPATRFGVSTPKYSRSVMGLDLSREEDWFRHYFADMTKSLKSSTLESMGLWRVKPATVSTPAIEKPRKDPLHFLIDLFWG